MPDTPFLEYAYIELRDGVVVLKMKAANEADAQRLIDAVVSDFRAGLVVFGEIAVTVRGYNEARR